MPDIRASHIGAEYEPYGEKVNPPHYQSNSGIEAIHVIEAFGLDFCKGNSVKYLLRAGKKEGENEVDDLRKAEWYIKRRIAQLEGDTHA